MRTLSLSILFCCSTFAFADLDMNAPLLARNPAMSENHIAFELAGDLWIMPREGGRARRLTVGEGVESNPTFSPDGSTVAFSGVYDGNVDVYVVPITGGMPRRLTFHPASDTPYGWSPDGREIIFGSARSHAFGQPMLYTVPVTGGWPKQIPLPRGNSASYSPDGQRLAYIPHDPWQPAWKRHRGGQTTPIWIAQLSDSRIEKIPRNNSNDSHPMWVGDTIYFLSDRNNASKTLYAYETRSKRMRELLKPEHIEIKSASAGPGGIVFEHLGSLHLYDFTTRQASKLSIEIADDFLEVRPAFRNVASQITGGSLSPSGQRVVFSARGDLFTVPAQRGDTRNLTNTPGVAERSPQWSPDGSKIAYLSDESDNYQLHVLDVVGDGKKEVYELGGPSWYTEVHWSPDGKKITFLDQTRTLYYLDLEARKTHKVHQARYYLFHSLAPRWSSDSKWITFADHGRNHLRAIWVHSLEDGKNYQITDGLSDASSPIFDRNGRYLYFLASTDTGQTVSWADMTSMYRPVTRSVYVVVLRNDDPSPLLPESDEEAGPPRQDKPEEKKPEPMRIDLEGIGQRILALPVPQTGYTRLEPGAEGSFFLLQGSTLTSSFTPTSVSRFDLSTRRATPFLSSVGAFSVGPRGDKVLVQSGGGWQIVPTTGTPQPGQGAIRTNDMQMLVDPRAEWRQMFVEAWRNQRDFFYDPNLHGLDLQKAKARFEPYLRNLVSSTDFSYLLQDMLNEVNVSHMFSFSGGGTQGRFVPGGLLGADYSIENGRYRFARIYNGENWNPEVRAPLTQPGANVKQGEYLLAVNGRELTADQNVYEAFENTANRQVRIKVGPNPGGSGSREVIVVPVANEGALRTRAWTEDNRRRVDELSGGRIAYVHMPNTSDGGFQSFNRYFVAQLDRNAVLMDDRFNAGGLLSDYVIDILNRTPYGFTRSRAGEDMPVPAVIIPGPAAMLINESAGSGGDALPWYFRTAKRGPLIGTRTWGGLVGVAGGVPLLDGGWAGSPQSGVYGVRGEWEVENVGVSPDIEVEEDPFLWRQGRDPQLERGVRYLLEQLQKNPPREPKRPAYPDHHRNTGLGRGG